MISRAELEERVRRTEGHFDVIVAGGGPAGLGAAVSAALLGKKTVLLEATSAFGGVASLALWMPMNRLMKDGGPRGGAHARFVEIIRSLGPDASREGKKSFIDGDGLHIHPDYLKLGLFRLLESVHCAYRLHSPVVEVKKTGRSLNGVVCKYHGKSVDYSAPVFVDATGDGDVAFLAGASFMEGREEDGVHMPITLVFAVSNVDVETFYAFHDGNRSALNALIAEAKEAGYATAPWYSFDRTTVPGVVSINNGGYSESGNLDGTDMVDMTLAERFGIEVATDVVEFARERKIPGMEKCCLIRTGAAAAPRDTRRIRGEYLQTYEDATGGTDFPDVVARKYGAVDAVQLYQGAMKSGFGYPYRSLLPVDLDNLLVAGRCASASFMGHASGKSMGNMMALGQAAGVAAALAVDRKLQPREVPVSAIQAALASIGAVQDI